MIKSLLIKAAILGIGVAVVFWFGWSVPQQNQRSSSTPRPSPAKAAHEVDQVEEREKAGQKKLDGNRSAPPTPLDINRGTKEEIQALPGIGPVLADRIIQYRESKGRFEKIEDLTAIQGIGETRLAELRGLIKVNPGPKRNS